MTSYVGSILTSIDTCIAYILSWMPLLFWKLYPMNWADLANADPWHSMAMFGSGVRSGNARPATCCWSQCAAPWEARGSVAFFRGPRACTEPCLPLCLPAVSQVHFCCFPLVSHLFQHLSSNCGPLSFYCLLIVSLLSRNRFPLLSRLPLLVHALTKPCLP